MLLSFISVSSAKKNEFYLFILLYYCFRDNTCIDFGFIDKQHIFTYTKLISLFQMWADVIQNNCMLSASRFFVWSTACESFQFIASNDLSFLSQSHFYKTFMAIATFSLRIFAYIKKLRNPNNRLHCSSDRNK